MDVFVVDLLLNIDHVVYKMTQPIALVLGSDDDVDGDVRIPRGFCGVAKFFVNMVFHNIISYPTLFATRLIYDFNFYEISVVLAMYFKAVFESDNRFQEIPPRMSDG